MTITIYDHKSGNTLTEGLSSELVSSGAYDTAVRIATERGITVELVYEPAAKTYVIGPDGVCREVNKLK